MASTAMSFRPSRAHCASGTPLLGETIGANLRRTAYRFGEREALVVRHQQYRITYRELWHQTELAARGVRKGDRVGIWSPNRYELKEMASLVQPFGQQESHWSM